VKISLKTAGLVAAAFLISACSAQNSAPTVPAAPTSGSSAASFASQGGGSYKALCPGPRLPDMMYCDSFLRTDVHGASPDVNGWGAPDLQSAYNLPSSTNGNGQIVAIVDAYGYPTAEDDMGAYRANFGLPACTTANGCFKKLNQKGQAKNYPPTNGGWDTEQALDIEMVSAGCPNCHIILVQANNSSAHNLGIAVNQAIAQGATVVSNSYSGICNAVKVTRCHGTYYDHPGVVILASSGDSGYQTTVGVPAAFPTVVSVGGTVLRKISSGRGWSEAVWNGAGSFCTKFPKPSWQTDTGCASRTVSDVAAVATGVAIYITGRWGEVAGTSISSPLVGSVYGLAGNATSMNAAESLYSHTSDLYDITSGSNGQCSPAYLCTGEVGYDGPTGNGSPNGVGAF
jgi:subtilase family serine protease